MNKTKLILCIICCGLVSLAAVDDKDHSGADSVEQRQMIELKRYYFGAAQSGASGVPQIPMSIEFYNDAVKYFEQGQYDIAKEAAEESARLDPRNPLAWEILGDLANLRQDFDKAEKYYKKSYRLNASVKVKEKLEKLSKERLIEGKMDTYEEEHFIIKYDRDDSKYEGVFLKNMLRETYRNISQDLGFYIRGKIVVIFYEPKDFRYVTEQPHFVGGVYDGKIRLPAYRKGFSQRDLRATAAHEMTHAFVAYLSSSRAPAWVQEGLAEYEENKIRPIDLTMLKSVVRTGKTIPIDQLLIQDVNMNSQPTRIALFYQESFSFVNYLLRRFRMYRMKEILQELRKGTDSFAAIEEVLKISPNRLEQEWLASVRK